MAEQLVFADREEFRQWLSENHGSSKGVWLVFSKISGLKTLKPGRLSKKRSVSGGLTDRSRAWATRGT